MQLLDADDAVAHDVTRFESSLARFAPLLVKDGVSIGVMRLGAGGALGRHAAVGDQLFIVVEGQGWVAGDDGRRMYIAAGAAALWAAGEQHESGTTTGMAVVVVEMVDRAPR